MSFAEGILWFLSTFVGCWGASLIVRGLRGEGLRKKWVKSEDEKKKIRYRPTWKLVLLGLGALACGLAAGWFAGEVHAELSGRGNTSTITPWQIGSAGVLVFGVILLTHAIIGDRSKRRQRCPKCWYDLSGVRFGKSEEESGTVTCSEYGREIAKPSELGRARRSKVLIVVAALVAVQGTLGVTKTVQIDRPMQLVPGRVLAWLLFMDGESPRWVRDEINARVDPPQGLTFPNFQTSSMSSQMWRGWAKQITSPDSVIWDEKDFNAFINSLWRLENDSAGRRIPLDRLNTGWNTQGLALLEGLVSEDAIERAYAREATDTFQMAMMLGVVNHPEIPELAGPSRSRLNPQPAEYLDGIVISNELDTKLRAVLISEPATVEALNSLLGSYAYERFPAEIAALGSRQDVANRVRGIAASILGAAAQHSPEANEDLTQMLEGNDENLKQFAITALRFNGLLSDIAVDSDRQLTALLKIASDSANEYQRFATQLLIQAAGTNMFRVEPLTLIALTDPIEAQRLIEVSQSPLGNLNSVRDALFERLSESMVTEVRHVVASAPQPYFDVNGKIRPVLEKLAEDEDEEVAAAAADSLKNLQSE